MNASKLPDEGSLRHPGTGMVLVTLLAQGRHIDRLSMALLFGAIVLLAAGMLHDAAGWRTAWAVCVWLSVAGAVAQRYYALRVRIDEQLFTHMYARPRVDDEDLRRMDAGLAVSAGKPVGGRSLHDRWTGTLRLWRRQILCCAVQAVLLVAAGGFAWWH
jgi:hypothetical protein